MTRRAALVRATLGFVVVGVLAAACGVSTNGKPRPINPAQVRDLVEASSTSTPAANQNGTETIRLYFVCAAHIVEVTTKSQTSDPHSVLDRLLAGPTQEDRALGYTTYIPPSTRLLALDLTASGVLVLQLSKEMDALSGQSAKTAYAQLVFTATGTSDVKAVAFQTKDNDLLAVPTDSVNKKTVTRSDYGQAPVSSTSSPTTTAAAQCPSPTA
jgi:spore germination protein GerM